MGVCGVHRSVGCEMVGPVNGEIRGLKLRFEAFAERWTVFAVEYYDESEFELVAPW